MRKPVIASVQGHCLGGGCELVMMCDLTIAADNALFGEPEIRFSNVGPAMIMPFIIGLKRARDSLLRGSDRRTGQAPREGHARRPHSKRWAWIDDMRSRPRRSTTGRSILLRL